MVLKVSSHLRVLGWGVHLGFKSSLLLQHNRFV